MNCRELIRSINNGKLESVYLLYGEERYYASQLESALVEAALPPADRDMGLQIFEQDPSVAELVQAVDSAPFFGGKNVIILRDTKWFRAGKNENAQEADKSDEKLLACLQSIPESTHLLFVAGDKVDKRRKLYKTVEKAGLIVELTPLKAREAREWLRERLQELDKTMEAEALDYLMTGFSFMPQLSMGFLDNEAQKIALYAGGRKRITLADVKAVLSGVPEINVFAMIDALSQQNIALALDLLDRQLATGEAPIRLLMLIARQTRALLQAKELTAAGRNSQEIAKVLGLHPFVAEKMVVQSRHFSANKLKHSLLLISDVDRAIKSGRAGNVSLERIIIDMCRD